MKALAIPLLLILLAPTAFAELHGFSDNVGDEGLSKLSYSIYALAASIVIASMIIAGAISNGRK